MGKVFDRIYEEVKKIPKGSVATYGDIAKKAKTSARIVGFALHRNPEPSQIPCHRVVFQDGSLSSSYAFGGKDAQKRRLEEEGCRLSSVLGESVTCSIC